MAYREVTMLEVKEVLSRWLAGQSKKAITRQTGVARNTVRRYIKAAELEGLKVAAGRQGLTDSLLTSLLSSLRATERERGDSWATCVARHSFISAKLCEGVQLTKVQRLLKRHGAEVPYSTLYRYALVKLDYRQGPVSVPIADCAPGEEVQVDTGWMTFLEPDATGKRRRFRAWIFTSVHTRHRFAYPCFRESTESAIEACEAAWRFFGGIFRVMIPDNTKAIIQLADPLQPRINPAFLEYAQARGFSIDAARSGRPKDKARVERTVPTVREDCFRGERLLTLPDARRRAEMWSLTEYGMRRHTRTQRMPFEHFSEVEKAALMPAPTENYDIPVWSEPKVGPDQFAVVAKALYSLPRTYRRKRLRARSDSKTVRFYFNHEIVHVASRLPPGGRCIDPAHFPAERLACAQRDTAFLCTQAAAHGPAVGCFAEVLLDHRLPWTRMRHVYALLGLCRRYGDARVEQACRRALDEKMHDVRRLERMLKLALSETNTITGKVIPLARYLRPANQYAFPLSQKGDFNNKETSHDP
jgi:transposase